MKAIVADDEQIILDGLSSCIDWSGLGLTLVGLASDGSEALELVRRYLPEIIVTDIKMPVIDGLELIRRVQAIQPESVFVILSAYHEFEIAQEAMRNGVRYYVLKPLSPSRITAVLHEAIAHYRDSYSVRAPAETAETEYAAMMGRVSHPAVRRVLRYVSRRYHDPDLMLAQVASDVAYMNPDYLSRLFSGETGVSFSRFLAEYRIDHARRILSARPDARSQELAAEVGFGRNAAYFCEVFHRVTGTSLTDYRRDLRRG